jgi:hypothetical protein
MLLLLYKHGKFEAIAISFNLFFITKNFSFTFSVLPSIGSNENCGKRAMPLML